MTDGLDPLLASFWEGFPCPPPWQSGLLQQLNFSGCLGTSIGQRIRSLMISRCGGGKSERMDDNSTVILEHPVEPRFIMEACAMNCKLLIISVCIIVFVSILSAVIYLLYRNFNSKTTNGGRGRHDVNKAFNSCHYASAPVISRLDETSFSQGKEVCQHSKSKNSAPQNKYDKLRFPSEKHSQIYPGIKDRRVNTYENDFDTSNDYESIDDIDKCDSRHGSPWKFGRHYKFSQGETILSVSSDQEDTDDNLCQVSMDNLHDEESFSSVACNEAFEPEASDDDISRDYLAEINFDISGSNLTARVPEYVPTFSTFKKESVFS
ncbi:hypothetical protein LOTGIDRAFT_232670 [Lottia gigantea]|uniref:Uncharacterized protein n=1 Tax=Lottia gigantea TaxID=225164 RepID=V4AJB8_LOTGI|nr:hypothetical protein LOTGIDRAFT_232670 [Lottia gigantea]ESO93646.1 hypothetical protein LOTGIDRAFT_232670 [Lottia gigantea]